MYPWEFAGITMCICAFLNIAHWKLVGDWSAHPYFHWDCRSRDYLDSIFLASLRGLPHWIIDERLEEKTAAAAESVFAYA